MYVLSFFGVLYVLEVLNKNNYKILPRITMGNFFDHKLKIKEVTSLKEYIIELVEIHREMQEEEDISEFDLRALQELKENCFLQYLFLLFLYKKTHIHNAIPPHI